jgi:hypothetical protein
VIIEAAAAAKPPAPWVAWGALWKIVVVGVLAGAGLPAIFSIGLVALDRRPGGVQPADSDDRVMGGTVPGTILAVICFLVVLAAIGWGIYEIVSSS